MINQFWASWIITLLFVAIGSTVIRLAKNTVGIVIGVAIVFVASFGLLIFQCSTLPTE